MRILLSVILALAATLTLGCSNNKQIASPAENSKAAVQQPEAAPAPAEQADLSAAADSAPSVDYSPIYFAFDSWELQPAARARLEAMASSLRTNEKLRVTIEGHCDERGTTEYNLSLGEKRAQVIQGYLETLGVGAGQLKIISFGEERPAVAGNDEPAWSQNRRSEFVPVEQQGPTAAR